MQYPENRPLETLIQTQGKKDDYSKCGAYLSGLCWAKKTGIFILGTLTIMTVVQTI